MKRNVNRVLAILWFVIFVILDVTMVILDGKTRSLYERCIDNAGMAAVVATLALVFIYAFVITFRKPPD